MKSLLDKDFVYVRAIDTDIRKTFERIRKAAPQVPEVPEPAKRESERFGATQPAVAAPVTQIRRKTCSSR